VIDPNSKSSASATRRRPGEATTTRRTTNVDHRVDGDDTRIDDDVEETIPY
jgi:hypothetical protein